MRFDDRGIPENKWINCDYSTFQLPIREFAREETLAGRFPLWCPLIACGSPLHATQQGSFCHPILTPLVLICGASYGIKICLFLHFSLTFIGSYLLARCLSASRASSSLCATITTWSGFAISHLMAGHVTIILEYAAVPWFLLALERLVRASGPIPAAGLTTVIGLMILGGHPQIPYYALLLGACSVTGATVIAKGRRLQLLGWVAVAVGAAILVGAVQLLPAAELSQYGLSDSERGSAAYASMYALGGVDVLRLAFPYILGNPFAGPELIDVSDIYQEKIVYLGLMAPFLAVFGLSRAGARPWQWGAALLILTSFLLAFGGHTPAFHFFLVAVPGMSLLRCPGRVLSITTVLVAVLAARGLDGLAEREPAARTSRIVSLAILIWLALNVTAYVVVTHSVVIGFRSWVRYASDNLRFELALTFTIVLAALCVLAAAWRRALSASMIKTAVILSTLVDLGYFNARSIKLGPLSPVRVPDGAARRGSVRFVDAPQFPSLERGSLQYSKLVPAAIAAHWQLIGTDEGGILPASTERLFQGIASNPESGLLAASCDYVCERRRSAWRKLDCLPRARFFDQGAATLVDTAIDDLSARDVRRMREGLCGTAHIGEETADRVVIDVVAPGPGRLVLADIWYPGWKATVDGRPITIDRAHQVFRTVTLSEGQHKVVFVYQPSSFRFGIAGTCAGVVLWAGLLIFGFKRPLRAELKPTRPPRARTSTR